MIANNPTIGIKKYRSANPNGYHTWTEDEVGQFLVRHPLGTTAHLAMNLMLCLGQRKSDAVRMGWQHIRNGKITLRQEKTITTHPNSSRVGASVSSGTPTNLTFLMTQHGKPFTAAGFGHWLRDRCDEAGLPQCTSHGLRKLAATRLADLGCSEREIMAITGHKQCQKFPATSESRAVPVGGTGNGETISENKSG